MKNFTHVSLPSLGTRSSRDPNSRRWRREAALLGGLLALALVVGDVSLAAMRAGVERIDITPPTGHPMGGYGARKGVSQGNLDPIYAQVLVLDDGRFPVALVTLDLVGLFRQEDMEAVRLRVRSSVGIQGVIFVSSHTHSGPVMTSIPESYKKALDQIGTGIETAYKKRVEARIGTGWGTVQIGANRRYVPPASLAVMLWRNETRISTFPVDPTVGVIRLDRSDGTALAVLVNYACHPVVLGPDNLDYSADFPGEMRKTIEAALPGSTAFFLQGGAGNINPYYDKTPRIQNAVALMRATGRRLGQEVLRVSRNITARAPASPEVKLSVAEMQFAPRYDPDKMMALLKKRYGERIPSRRLRRFTHGALAPVTTLLVNRELAFVGMPGEPFVEFQLYLRAHSPLPNSYFLGYCNGSFGYIPTIAAAVRGAYGAAGFTTPLEVGSGEQMIHRGIIEIYKLLGKLKSKPENKS